jgi:DNA-binding response OmpR family regulator
VGIDVILLDVSLPDSQEWSTFEPVRSRAKGLPIILLTGRTDEELGLRALKEGAQDYMMEDALRSLRALAIAKPFDIGALLTCSASHYREPLPPRGSWCNRRQGGHMKERRGSRILLVDDNANLLVTLGDFLAYEGFDVSRAESAEEALEQLETDKPDLIVLDISMPGMGGMGFLKRISRDDGTLNHPVLVLTARANMRKFFGSIPVQGFLDKSCSEKDLLEKINLILAARPGSTPRPASGSIHVLLAEDDVTTATRIMKVFRAQWPDCQIRVVERGPDLLEKAVESVPDLIIIKQVLGGMNGREVVSLLGLIPKTSSVPVILYSEEGESVQGNIHPGRFPNRKVVALSAADPAMLLRSAQEILRSGAKVE